MNIIRERSACLGIGPDTGPIYPFVFAKNTIYMHLPSHNISLFILSRQSDNRLAAMRSSGELYQLTRKYIWNHNYEHLT